MHAKGNRILHCNDVIIGKINSAVNRSCNLSTKSIIIHLHSSLLMRLLTLFSILVSCSNGNGLGYVRRGRGTHKISDGWLAHLSDDLGDQVLLTLEPISKDSTASKKVTDFFSEDVEYRFELVEDDDVIKIHRLPVSTKPKTADTTITKYSRTLMQSETDDEEENTEPSFLITNIILVTICIVTAALAAGLTMGLLSLDCLILEIKRRTATSDEERKWSEKLLPLLLGHSKRHRLMVSLLLMNAIANEALPLFLDELLPGKYASILVSVTLVLFFGEIVPSALFTGPNQVEISAKLVPLVKAVMIVLTPLAVPIAKLLDRVLHSHDECHDGVEEDVTEGNYMNRGELGALVRIQYEAQLADHRRRKHANQKLLRTLPGRQDYSNLSSQDSTDSSTRRANHSNREIVREMTLAKDARPTLEKMLSIHEDEITMIEGALTMTVKVAADVCTPLRRVFALPSETILNEDTCVSIWSRGFSRIPIYTSNSETSDNTANSGDEDISGIIGVLLSRQLIVLSPNEERPLATVPLVIPPCIHVGMNLVDVINMFQANGGRGKGGLHLAIVCARPDVATEALERGEVIPKDAGVVGILTLEDVIEEIIQEEIYDEVDRDLELSHWAVTRWKQFVKRKRLSRSQAVAAATEATPLIN